MLFSSLNSLVYSVNGSEKSPAFQYRPSQEWCLKLEMLGLAPFLLKGLPNSIKGLMRHVLYISG